MVPFEMSVDARMLLAKMSMVYERERGSRIRMSRDEDIVMLLNYAVDSINDEIARQYEMFRRLLSPLEVKALAAQGVNIYRGAVVNVQVDDMPGQQLEQGTQTYRGVAIEKQQTVASPGTQPHNTKATGKKVYRGRIIED